MAVPAAWASTALTGQRVCRSFSRTCSTSPVLRVASSRSGAHSTRAESARYDEAILNVRGC